LSDDISRTAAADDTLYVNNNIYLTNNQLQHYNDKDLKKYQQQQQQMHGQNKDMRKQEEAFLRLNTGQIYRYKLENFSNYGTVTCNSENTFGQSGPCLYHILAAGEFTIFVIISKVISGK
jgi:hypothetical protein